MIIINALVVAFLLLPAFTGCIPVNDGNKKDKKGSKIAFLFMSRGHMPLEDVWKEFFEDPRSNPNEYSIYLHPTRTAGRPYKMHKGSLFTDKEIEDTVEVHWGGWEFSQAMINLVKAALQDPENEVFCLLTDSCTPLLPLPQWRRLLLSDDKSFLNACPMSIEDGSELDSRWRPSLDGVFDKKFWRKSSSWSALQRRHAELVTRPYNFTEAWKHVHISDEHYFPSVLAYHGLDNETHCNDGYMYVSWLNLEAAHPSFFTADMINAELFENTLKKTHTLVTSAGVNMTFGSKCTGLIDRGQNICHFAARKFSPHARDALFRAMPYFLSEPGHPYIGDPYRHRQDKLRFDEEDRGKKYFYLDCGRKRQILRLGTIKDYLKIDISRATPMTEEERNYPVHFDIPDVVNGDWLSIHGKGLTVYYIEDGQRRACPNMDTFIGMGGEWGGVRSIKNRGDPRYECEVALGPPLPEYNQNK